LAALGNAIRRRRESLELTLDAISAATGISKPYLSNIETARAPGPASEEKLRKIAYALHLPAAQLLAAADWLRTPPSVRRLLHTAPPTSSRQVVESAIPLRLVPLINRVVASSPAELTDLDYPVGMTDDYMEVPDLPDVPITNAFALRITGDSMAPEYAEGDIIVLGSPTGIHGKNAIRDGDDCVVRLGDEANFATTFKRVYFVPGAEERRGAIRLVSLNPAYAERVVAFEQVTGIYPLQYRLVPPRRG